MALWREHPDTQAAIDEASAVRTELLATVARLQRFIEALAESESLEFTDVEEHRGGGAERSGRRGGGAGHRRGEAEHLG